jgi:hypothetical protein
MSQNNLKAGQPIGLFPGEKSQWFFEMCDYHIKPGMSSKDVTAKSQRLLLRTM